MEDLLAKLSEEISAKQAFSSARERSNVVLSSSGVFWEKRIDPHQAGYCGQSSSLKKAQCDKKSGSILHPDSFGAEIVGLQLARKIQKVSDFAM